MSTVKKPTGPKKRVRTCRGCFTMFVSVDESMFCAKCAGTAKKSKLRRTVRYDNQSIVSRLTQAGRVRRARDEFEEEDDEPK